MEFISNIWNNWLVLAFIAPALWALVNIVDLFLVNEAYEDEYDGAIVVGFFQIIPWLVIPWFGFSLPEGKIMMLALVGGALFCISMFFYFRALFATNDASLVLVLWNLTALAVPVLAFLLLREKLSVVQYSGILITFLGVLFLTLNKKIGDGNFKKIALIMLWAILFFSLSMVVQDAVYSNTEFWSGFLFFSLGNILGALVFLGLRKKKTIKHLFKLNQKYFIFFLLTEIITLTGVLSSQRAIDVSPSVSFVAAVESTQPGFIMILSLIIFAVFAILSLKKKELMRKLYEEQMIGYRTKIIAIIIMIVGIYLINS